MKEIRLLKTFALAIALCAGAVGCARHDHRLTPLPNGAQTGNGALGTPGEGGKIGEATPGSTEASPTGIPASGGHPGWNKDPETLKADTVHFDYDSTVIKASEKSKVAAVADYLKANPANAVEVEGHCDERGTDEYNRSLGERRALALREELAKLGVDPNRVDTVSYGRDRPVDKGHSEAAHRKNRRGEFVVLTPPK